MKKILSVCLLIAGYFNSSAQETKISITGSIERPLGSFSSTHTLGVQAAVNFVRSSDTSKHHIFQFTFKAGGGYFFGRTVAPADYPYTYPGYTIIYTGAGIRFEPVNRLNGSLTTGPGISFYNKTTRFDWVSNLTLAYDVSEKVSIGPRIQMIKEFGADALWTAGLQVTFHL